MGRRRGQERMRKYLLLATTAFIVAHDSSRYLTTCCRVYLSCDHRESLLDVRRACQHVQTHKQNPMNPKVGLGRRLSRAFALARHIKPTIILTRVVCDTSIEAATAVAHATCRPVGSITASNYAKGAGVTRAMRATHNSGAPEVGARSFARSRKPA